MKSQDYMSPDPVAWCPGCGNFGILNALKKALVKLDKRPQDVLLVSGIGQAAKLPHYIKANCFNGLHGRALPVACGAKIANKELTVIVTTGDGDCYGEGGNHFLHNIRRNIDITVIVHNNQIYGLTKGQASPTTDPGYATPIQTHGVILEPFHALALALVAGAGFVARSFSKDSELTADLIVQAVRHKGFALLEVLQPCVTFNRKNTYAWYAQRIYTPGAEHPTDDRMAALQKCLEWGDRIPLGVLYNVERKTYEENSGLEKLGPLLAGVAGGADVRDVLSAFE
ncbi:MAG: 2-oxoacid:ferredoxin oxidoreductase subunit beta [Deltaproteobacteria bacterium]